MTTEECDRCGYADVSWCMSNGCDKGQRRLEWMEEVGIIKSDCLNEFESQTVEDIKSCIIIAMEIEDNTAALVVMADYWKQLKESVMNRTKFQEGQALLVDVGKELKLYTLNKWIESLEN